MQSRKIVYVILQVLCATAVLCQNLASIDWQFDPYSTDQWLKQKQDHYDSANIQYWPQRYLTSYKFYRLGGPIFLYLSGPGPELTLNDIESGAIASYAEEQGAFMIGFEHRFYGKSRPTQDLSKDSLKYLTIPQTIEDIAAFIRSWKSRDEFNNNKWVLFGGSYLGSIAAWFAQKHPELIDAFVASSAPLELRYEIPEFLQNVGGILNQTDSKCFEAVADGFSCLENIINEQGCESYNLEDVKSKFELCAELDTSNALDTNGVFAELFSTVNAVVMYHDPNPKSFAATDLNRFCKYMTSDNGEKSAMEKLGDRVKEINKHRGLPCAEFRFQTTVDFLKDTEWDSPASNEGYRQLQWQLCNELGWTVASVNVTQPFGNYLSPLLHSEICQKLFGLTETEMRLKVLQSNTNFKGKQLTAQCGIYVNGDHDPWHSYSITTPEEAGKCNRAILIEGGSHGRDVEAISNSSSFPPQVQDAQRKIAKYLDSWLKSGKCCEEDTAESRRVISTHSRRSRAPDSKEFYSSANTMLKPNVDIRPHSYSVDGNEELLVASPTSIPYQVSTADVLSVSPRIPVANKRAEPEFGNDMYRDPRNAEFRRYRIVKMLRHRPSFAPWTYGRGGRAPSMEQFEADFPEHSIRVEGRVERVYKNGSLVSNPVPAEATQAQDDQQTYQSGRQLPLPTPPTPKYETSTSISSSVGQPENHRFRYVIKQVFRETVTEANLANNKTTPRPDNSNTGKMKDLRFRNSPKPPNAKRISENSESLEIDISSTSTEETDDTKMKTSNIQKRESNEDTSASSSSDSTSSEEKGDALAPAPQKPIKSSKPQETSSGKSQISQPNATKHSDDDKQDDDDDKDEDDDEDKEGDNDEDKEGDDDEGKEGDDDEEKEGDDDEEKEGGPDDEGEDEATLSDQDGDYDDENDDGSYPDEDRDDENIRRNHDREDVDDDDYYDEFTPIRRPSAKPVKTSKAKNSTKYSSGEGVEPKRLREKVFEKIKSSSEDGGKPTSRKLGDKKNADKADLDSSASSSSSEQIYSDEDYNYSLEPSGSNTHKAYRKKHTPSPNPMKPLEEEPRTVINVEISGSYPKRQAYRKKKSKRTTTTTSTTETPEKDDTDKSREGTSTTAKPAKRRRAHRRRKPPTTRPSVMENYEAAVTTENTEESATTPFPPITTTTGESFNHYANWNRRKLPAVVKPLQQEQPTTVNLGPDAGRDIGGNGPYFPQPETPANNDVVYIIMGDVPKLDGNENSIEENPSANALFDFIQRLVSRHSSDIFTQQQTPVQYFPPPPPPPPSTTTTITPIPAPSGPTTLPISHNHPENYLLVRPVKLISLGREHVVHAHDLKNDSFLDLVTTGNPPGRPYPYTVPLQNYKRQNIQQGEGNGYGFKSPLHRDHFQQLLSVDSQSRDSDLQGRGEFRHAHGPRTLDEIPDPSWRSIRGLTQFGPALASQRGPAPGLLSLSAADTMWVNEGVPFLPRINRQVNAGRNFDN